MSASKLSFHDGQVVFSRFGLSRKLGEGGMGEVWLAQDVLLEKKVALKFLPGGLVRDLDAYELLKREAQKSMLVTHPNIVRIHDFHRTEELAAISMEYVEGSTLSRLQSQRPDGIFEPHELQRWVAQLCDGLHYAHTKVGLVHRDLKPSNLMIDLKGDLKVTDFGLAGNARPAGDPAHEGPDGGTLVFMGPQQLRGSPCQPADDIYSLGATLHALLAGVPPFYQGDIVAQILHATPPSIRANREAQGINRHPVASHWEAVIARCLAKEPADRPPSARDVAIRLLNQALPPQPPPVPSGISIPQSPADVDGVGSVVVPSPPDAVSGGTPGMPDMVHGPSQPRVQPSRPHVRTTPAPGFSTRTVLLAGLAGLAVLGAAFGAFFLLSGRQANPPSASSESVVVAPASKVPVPIATPVAFAEPKVPVPASAPVSAAPAPAPVPPVVVQAPSGLVLDSGADWACVLSGGRVVLSDRAAHELCVWTDGPSASLRRVPLADAPVAECYSSVQDCVYVGYGDGRITKVLLSDLGHAQELPYTRHPSAPRDMVSLGKSLLVASGGANESWWSHVLYDGGGRKMDERKMVFRSRGLTWSPKHRRVYWVSQGVSPVDVMFDEITPGGKFGTCGDSPYHGTTGIWWPVLLSGRSDQVVLGSGRIMNPLKLEFESTLPCGVRFLVDDAAVSYAVKGGSDAYGAMEPTLLEIVRLNAERRVDASAAQPGQPVALGLLPGGPCAVVRLAGKAVVYRFDRALGLVR